MKHWKTKFGAMLVAACLTSQAVAHEFWIEGAVATERGKSSVGLDLNVGQQMSGRSLPFIPEHVVTFRQLNGPGLPIKGRTGSVPAASADFDARKGLSVAIEMAPRTVEHSDWKTFLQYLGTEGLEEIEARHIARDLPLSGFTESYARHAKLLILGSGKETRIPAHRSGAVIEIEVIAVSETTSAKTALQGRLLIGGHPGSRRQVSVFERMNGAVRSYSVETDKNGSFRAEVMKGAEVLLNSVHMTAASDAGKVWHSDWASLTVYRLPE